MKTVAQVAVAWLAVAVLAFLRHILDGGIHAAVCCTRLASAIRAASVTLLSQIRPEHLPSAAAKRCK